MPSESAGVDSDLLGGLTASRVDSRVASVSGVVSGAVSKLKARPWFGLVTCLQLGLTPHPCYCSLPGL